jgi:hypothetical protein
VPLLKLDSYSDLLCLETMPACGGTLRNCILEDLRRSEKRVRLITASPEPKCVDLTCHESMPC